MVTTSAKHSRDSSNSRAEGSPGCQEIVKSAVYRKIGRVIRTARKELGISQADLAKSLGYRSQGAISKVENGQYSLAADQLIEFSKISGIPIGQIFEGYIDKYTPSKLIQSGESPAFTLPKRYAFNRGTTVRHTAPMIDRFEEALGQDAFQQFAKSRKIDPDYFVNRSNQINMSFNLDMLEELARRGHLSEDTFGSMTSHIFRKGGALKLHRLIGKPANLGALFTNIVKSIRYIESNFEYALDSVREDAVSVSCKPMWHVSDIECKHDPVTQSFLCHFRKRWMIDLASYAAGLSVEIHEPECYHRRGNKCLYRISTVR